MPRLLWLTDIHLDLLSVPANVIFAKKLFAMVEPGDSVVITGDIAESSSVREFMFVYRKGIQDRGGKLYFVLGNHDFYGGSIKQVTEACEDLLGDAYLPAVGIGKLTDKTAIVGHDGWWDGLYANYFKSRLDMNENKIMELSGVFCVDKGERFRKINELAQKAADHVEKYASEAAENHEVVVIGTHIPPFRENSVYNGKQSDDDWMPHFSSKRMGDALLRLAGKHPRTEFIVLCGHSHGHAVYKVAHNMVSYTGEAEYRDPKLAATFILT